MDLMKLLKQDETLAKFTSSLYIWHTKAMTALVEYGTRVCIRLLIFTLSRSFGLHLDKTGKVLIFGNAAKRTLSVTVCEKVVPRLNKHDDVIE